MMKAFDLVGTIHGREYSDHGEYVTADDYYHLMLHGEAVARLKLGLEDDVNKLKAENEALLEDKARLDWLCGRYTHVTDGHTYHRPEGELVAYRWSVEDACGTVREAIDFGMNRSPENP